VPKRGISSQSLGILQEYATKRNMNMVEAMFNVEHSSLFNARQKNGFGLFLKDIRSLRETLSRKGLLPMLQQVSETIGGRNEALESDIGPFLRVAALHSGESSFSSFLSKCHDACYSLEMPVHLSTIHQGIMNHSCPSHSSRSERSRMACSLCLQMQ